MNIGIEDLTDAVIDALETYSEEITEDVKAEVTKAGNYAKQIVKEASPELTGDYKKGWTVKVAYDGPNDRRVVIHNRTDYQLTHLLEDGFVGRSGKKVEGKTHIADAQIKAEEYFEKRVEDILKR